MTTDRSSFAKATLQLSALLEHEDMVGLEAKLLELSMPVVCSQDFIDFCRERRENRLVIMLATIAQANGYGAHWAGRVLDLYQSAMQSNPVGSLAQLPDSHVLRQALAVWVGGENLPLNCAKWGKRRVGSDADVELAVGFLLDHDRTRAAVDLILHRWESKSIDPHLLNLVALLISRQAFRKQTEATRAEVIRCARRVYARIENRADMADVRDMTAFLLTENCMHSANPIEATIWAKRVRSPQLRLKASWMEALAICKLGQTLESAQVMDQFFTRMVDQPVDWIQKNFRGQAGNKAYRQTFPLEKAQQALSDLQTALAEIGEKAFICWGTLLGYARVGNFLSHDKDVDVGILSDRNPIDIANHLFQSGTFRPLAVTLTLLDSTYLAVYHVPSAMALDISFFVKREQRLETNIPVSVLGIPRWFSFPHFEVTESEFVGVKTYVPRDVDAFLTTIYGNWRIPDPYFQTMMSSPALTDHGSPEYLVMARIGVHGAFAKDSPQHAMRALNILRQHPGVPAAMSPLLLDRLTDHFASKADQAELEGAEFL
jgi:hypothetical protein